MFPTFRTELPRKRRDQPTTAVAERFPRLIGGDAGAVESLASMRLGIVTAGSVAGRIAQQFSRLSPAEITIVDPACFKPQSILTHAIPPEAIGQSKAIWTADCCREISPTTQVVAHPASVQSVPAIVWFDCDYVVAAPDNLPCERYLGELTLNLGVPLILASVHGESLTAQVRTFANDRADGPCPGCGFNDVEWRAHDESLLFSCAGGTVSAGTRPTMSTAFLCSMAANLAVVQIVRHRLRLGLPVSDSILSWCAYTHQPIVAALRRNPRCRCDHRRWECTSIAERLTEFSIDRLLHLTGIGDRAAQARVTIQIDGYSFVERAECGCGETRIGRFVADGGSIPTACPNCGTPPVASPFFTRRELPCDDLPRNLTLSELGASRVPAVRISAGERHVFVRSTSFSQEATA